MEMYSVAPSSILTCWYHVNCMEWKGNPITSVSAEILSFEMCIVGLSMNLNGLSGFFFLLGSKCSEFVH